MARGELQKSDEMIKDIQEEASKASERADEAERLKAVRI